MRIIKKTKIKFLEKKTIALGVSLSLIIAGLFSLVMKGGPELSIDFTGGTIVQILFKKSPEIRDIRSNLESNGFNGAEVIEFGSSKELLIKTELMDNTEEANKKLNSALKSYNYEKINDWLN